MIAQVRRFNRTVTQRVGALDDRYLARDRPLGEARVLWEIGDDGCDVRVAARPGSTSTPATSAGCCASLEADGLVTVEPSDPATGASGRPGSPRAGRAERDGARPAQRRRSPARCSIR